MKAWKLPFALAAFALGACGTPMVTNDSGNDQPDSTPSDAAPADASTDTGVCQQPALPNLCSMENCDFAPFTLPSCAAEGGNVQFYDQSFCEAEATLLVIAAGWCVPCQMEAPMIEQLITQAEEYQGKVRVISVIGQNPDYSEPTPAFCRTWQNRYHLTSHMAIDPTGLTQRYFPDMAFPANLIIDRHGRIRYRTYGTSRGLTELRAALDDVLANP
jgi:thiol-disulfide isomerase/thioredoxin